MDAIDQLIKDSLAKKEKTFPPDLVDHVRKVVEHNDQFSRGSENRINLSACIRTLKSMGYSISVDTIYCICRDALGRKTYAKK